MDCSKAGKLIKEQRTALGLTQKQLADSLNISDKAVSKWERGLGFPDVSLLSDLSKVLMTDISGILDGKAVSNTPVAGNMLKSKYRVCPVCGSITVSTGNAEVSCCGHILPAVTPKKADEGKKLRVTEVEDEWFIESLHPATRENYISFIAFATGESIQILKQYPEWDISARIPKKCHGTLLFYSTTDGLFYQYI